MTAVSLLFASALLLSPPATASASPAGKPAAGRPVARDPFDLRPELRALVQATQSGHVIVRTLDDGSRLTVNLADGKVTGWFLEPAKGTPEGVFNYDRSPNPKDKRECAVLLARSAFTTAYAVDCAHLPPAPQRKK
jgi:hypothetical protein